MKKLLGIVVLGLLWCNVAIAGSAQEYINKYLSNRKLDLIEGVWDIWDGDTYKRNVIWRQSGNNFLRQSLSEKQLRCGNKGYISKSGNSYSETGNAIKNNCKVMTSVNLQYNYIDANSGSATAYAYGDSMSLSMKRIWPKNINSHNAKFGGSSSGDSQLSFTIKDKKEQCKAIGFKPASEKFADCVLKLVELDIKSQVNNQSTTSVSSGANQQIITELQRQNNMRQSQFLMNLSQQLLTPSAPASLPSTTRCVLSPVGGNVVMNCR